MATAVVRTAMVVADRMEMAVVQTERVVGRMAVALAEQVVAAEVGRNSAAGTEIAVTLGIVAPQESD